MRAILSEGMRLAALQLWVVLYPGTVPQGIIAAEIRPREQSMPSPDPAFKPASRENFVDDIHGKSDRAVAIVGAALLNTHLDYLLGAFFTDEDDDVRKLLDEDRPLGSFSARIRLAYVLGLISQDERVDLWAVQQIQDFFTRAMDEIAFSDEPLREWCYSLQLPNSLLVPGESRSPRRLFVFAVALLTRHLAKRIEQAETDRRRPAGPFQMVEVKK
jgi:mannitol operon repressor